jgi:hypothetical protein
MNLVTHADKDEIVRLILDNFWYGSGDQGKFSQALHALSQVNTSRDDDDYLVNLRYAQLVAYTHTTNIINAVLDIAMSMSKTYKNIE